MRNFEERKAEVFRRSHERIRQRKKKRRQLLLLGVPLVCAVLLVTVYLPWRMPSQANESGDAAPQMEMAVDQSAELETAEAKSTAEVFSSADEIPAAEPTDWTAPNMGLRLIVDEVDNTGEKLSVLWNNDTDWTVTYGPVFAIEQLTQDGWISCDQIDLGWDDVLYELQPRASDSQVYDLTRFAVSQPGTYRIVAKCCIYTDEETYETYITAEFEVP